MARKNDSTPQKHPAAKTAFSLVLTCDLPRFSVKRTPRDRLPGRFRYVLSERLRPRFRAAALPPRLLHHFEVRVDGAVAAFTLAALRSLRLASHRTLSRTSARAARFTRTATLRRTGVETARDLVPDLVQRLARGLDLLGATRLQHALQLGERVLDLRPIGAVHLLG